VNDLEALFELVTRRSGCALSRQQRDRVTEAAQRLAKGTPLGLFVARLDRPEGARELLQLLSSVSVHKTDLFRDEQQLAALEEHVLVPLAQKARALQLWSAGCATGEEVATLLLLLERAGAHPASRVLGTDLSAAALERARRFTYSEEAVRRVPSALTTRFFERTAEGLALAPPLRSRARFLEHNLMETPYPFPEVGTQFDVIVCRNVLIYFTPEAVERTVTALAERLAPEGALVFSASEPLLHPRLDLEPLRVGGAFFYRPRRQPPAPTSPPPGPTKPARPSSVSPPRPSAPPPAPIRAAATGEAAPEQEGEALFSLVLEWSAAGQDDRETEKGLRRALYLAPQLAAARYCLGRLLEQRGERADAMTEYRRALSLIEQQQAKPTPFFLNLERLAGACRLALARLRQ